MALAETVFTQVFNHVLDRITAANVSVTSAEASKVAQEVTKGLAPVILNQTNTEPLYKSRIMRGALLVVAGLIGGFLGINFTDGDLEQGIHAITSLAEAVGILYVLYGRLTTKGTPRI